MQGVIHDLEKIWSAGVFGKGEAATQANENAAQESGGKYSFAGLDARDVDIITFAKVREMEEEGYDIDSIREKTGWFRRRDGELRFEIDDSEMTLNPKLGTIGAGRFNKQYQEGGLKLSEVISHDRLFKSYPFLKDVNVAFDIPAEQDAYGGWQNSGPGHISLNEKLLGKERDEDLLDTIIHRELAVWLLLRVSRDPFFILGDSCLLCRLLFLAEHLVRQVFQEMCILGVDFSGNV